jgi:S1-C subfamily serine protease
MTDQWYYRQTAAEFGPYTGAQLRQLAQSGRITAATLVRPGKNGDWILASQVKSLWVADRPKAARVANVPPPLPSRPSSSAARATAPGDSQPVARAHPQRKKAAILIGACLGVVLLVAGLLVYLAAARAKRAVAATAGASDAAEQSPAVVAGQMGQPPAQAALPANNPAAGHGAGLSTEQIVARCESAVALIKGRVSSGTGFLIAPDVLVTNKHVLSHELIDLVEVYFPSAKAAEQGPFKPTLLLEDEKQDLSVLRVKTNLKPVTLARNYQFRRGQEITVIGSPGLGGGALLQNAVSRGVMSTEINIHGLPYYQLGISINPGNSGGPAFDSDAQVIGVVTLKASEKEGLGFCIPVAEVRRLRDRLQTVTQHEIDLMQAMHRLRVTYRSIALLGQAYKSGMRLYVSAMQTAIDQQQGADAGLSAVQDKVQSKLQSIDHVLLGVLRSEIPHITSDPNVSEPTRQKLADFWANYLEMKSYVDNPRGSYLTYQAKCNELSDSHDRLSESIKAMLGLGDEED